MKAFRLAIVRQKYRPDGGAERFVSRALTALKDQNLELNVITREWQGETNPDWHIYRCNPIKWGRISRERNFAKAAVACWQSQKFDLVQSHERIPGCDIYRAGDGVHRRWLLQRARILPRWKQKQLMTHRYHRYVIHAEQQMYTHPNLQAVICNAQMIKKEIIEDYSVDPAKIHVIYNAIDNQKFSPANESQRQQARQQFAIEPDAHCLIFVGSGFERKGLAAAIRALAQTESHLLVVGRDKTVSKYQQLAVKLGCQMRVHFAGMQADTISCYHACDGLLLPTLYDPFPNVILEAMACGLPVITTYGCGGAEFICDGVNGFVVDALDIPAISQRIQQLAANAKQDLMGIAARNTILPHTPARLSEQLVALYQHLLTKKSA